jgi:hypothetical protein
MTTGNARLWNLGERFRAETERSIASAIREGIDPHREYLRVVRQLRPGDLGARRPQLVASTMFGFRVIVFRAIMWMLPRSLSDGEN